MKKAWSLATQGAHSNDWSDWMDTQADLSLRWAHMPFCWYCHEAARLMLILSISDKILRHLNFPCFFFFFEKFHFKKHFWTWNFYLSTNFQSYYCSFYDKFKTKYWHENILPPAKQIKRIPEKSFSEVKFIVSYFVRTYIGWVFRKTET